MKEAVIKTSSTTTNIIMVVESVKKRSENYIVVAVQEIKSGSVTIVDQEFISDEDL